MNREVNLRGLASRKRGLDALVVGSSRPKRKQAAFEEKSVEALRELLYRSSKEFGRDSSLWTLEMAAEVSFEQEGLIEKRVCGETRSGRRLRAFSQCAGSAPSGGLRVLIPCTK